MIMIIMILKDINVNPIKPPCFSLLSAQARLRLNQGTRVLQRPWATILHQQQPFKSRASRRVSAVYFSARERVKQLSGRLT
jgi:hypothetical protein